MGAEKKRDEEIEVTPEMIAAGGRELEKHYVGDGRYVVDDGALAAIFSAMLRARPKQFP